MRTGRPKQPLILTEDEQDRLQSLDHRARRQSRLARRARVVLACAEGLDHQTVAKKLRGSLERHGWQVAFLLPANAAGRTLRRTTPGGAAPDYPCPGRAGCDSDLAKHAARLDPWEHARLGSSHRTQPDDHPPDRACFRVAATWQRNFQMAA